MKLTDIIEKDLSEPQDLCDFVMMGEVKAAEYIHEMIKTIRDTHDYIVQNDLPSFEWNKAINVQIEYICRYRALYGKDFTENLNSYNNIK